VSRFKEIRGENFTRAGLEALFDYLEDMELDTGSAIEFDPIALCCEFREYEDVAEYNADYVTEFDDRENVEEVAVFVGSEGFICFAH
jgi:hypothetical protein